MQKLMPLSLESTPAAEVMAGTALAWHEVLVHGRVFEQARDLPRFREAFRTLAGRQRRWPAPIDFLEALPRIEAPRTPEPKLDSDASRAVGARHIGDIAALLKIEPSKAYAEVDDEPAA